VATDGSWHVCSNTGPPRSASARAPSQSCASAPRRADPGSFTAWASSESGDDRRADPRRRGRIHLLRPVAGPLRRLAGSGGGRVRLPARQERRRQDHDHPERHGADAAAHGTGAVEGTRRERPAAVPDRRSRHRLRARRPADLRRSHRVGEPRRRRAQPGGDNGLDPRARLRPLPQAPRAGGPAGRLPLRRRAADADDRAHAHGQPRAAAPRRALRGLGAARRGPPQGTNRPTQAGRPDHPPRRAERGLLPRPGRPRLRPREGPDPLRRNRRFIPSRRGRRRGRRRGSRPRRAPPCSA